MAKMKRTAENLEIVRSVIGQHEGRVVVGRTRMQKTIYLLQRVGLETSYVFRMHHYGPYSEELTADLDIGNSAELLTVEPDRLTDGSPFYKFRVGNQAELTELPNGVERALKFIIETDSTILELAATYNSFREESESHVEALQSLREKKGDKCANGREQQALTLLKKLDLAYN